VEERDAAILALLEAPRTLAGLAEEAPILGKQRYVPKLVRYFETTMIEKHLARLRQRGVVIGEDDLWRKT